MKKTSDTCPFPMEVATDPMVGKKYHVAWAHPGCVWVLMAIDGETCTMKTPKTKKTIKVQKKDLRLLRTKQFKKTH